MIYLYTAAGSEQSLLEKLHGGDLAQPTDKSNFLNRLSRLIGAVAGGAADLGIQVYPTMYSTWVAANADFVFAGQPSANDYCQVGARKFTFKVSGDSALDEVTIGGSVATTIANLVARINASTDAITASYVTSVVKNATTVTVLCSKRGRLGNMFAIVKSGANISISGDSNGCLGGGVETLPDALGSLVIA